MNIKETVEAMRVDVFIQAQSKLVFIKHTGPGIGQRARRPGKVSGKHGELCVCRPEFIR